MKNLTRLPDDLPVPLDDGACDHLPASRLPSLALPATSGQTVEPGACRGSVMLYCHPMIGRPDSPPLVGWNDIPGARGCTPQSCAFRDQHATLRNLGVTVYGLSAQPLAEQQEAAARLHLPFELLNDSSFGFTQALRLPTFEYCGTRYLRRLTLIATDGVIDKVFYPVFPPDRNAHQVIAWLAARRA